MKLFENEVDLSYKKVFWRPRKIYTSALVRYKLDYISFIEQCEAAGYLILQKDEFAVNRHCASSMAWVERNKSGYVVNDSPYESYSVISAITNNSLELVVTELGEQIKQFLANS